MKKLFLISCISLLLGGCKQSAKGPNGVTYKTPVAYNDFIVDRQSGLIKKVLEFGKVADISLDSAEGLLNTYIRDTEGMIRDIKGMPPYEGDSTLRDAAVGSFTFYKKIFDKEYREILSIRRKGEAMTPEDIERLNQIVENITKEEEQYDKRFRRAQDDFADKNKMRLKENEMQKKIDDLDKE
jgi:hypothetical protein